MYQLLVLSSSLEGNMHTLEKQIKYLEHFGISVICCIDPTENEFRKILNDHCFDCAYIHIKRRSFADNQSQYDPVKIVEQKNVPLLGSSYITQMVIADKFTTSKKSGIGLPNQIVSRLEFIQKLVDWGNIIDYPVIIKPNTFHASMGITEESVAWDRKKLIITIERLFNEYPFLNEVLIEKFVLDAQEYTVSVLGNGDSIACSVTKLQFKNKDTLRINSQLQKELPLQERAYVYAIEDDKKIRQRLEYHAKTLFWHFGMKDIARFDFVYDRTCYLLEANTCPIPGHSFSWEWQVKYGIKKEQLVALYLCAFHFGQVASGKPSRFPKSLIDSLPQSLISQLYFPCAVDVCPECSGPSENCLYPHLFSMFDRVSSEIEVNTFLNALTRLIKPKFILETGTYKGSSTIAFAEGLRQNNMGHMVTLEIDKDLSRRAEVLFAEYPVEVVNQSSLTYEPQDSVDLLYLDSKRNIRNEEFTHFQPYLSKRAIIVWHDSSYREQNHSVFDAVEVFYQRGIIDRILFPTPRGLTLSMLRHV